MKTFLAFIGGIHLVLFILGALNIIDYHVCIKDAGKCTADSTKEKQNDL